MWRCQQQQQQEVDKDHWLCHVGPDRFEWHAKLPDFGYADNPVYWAIEESAGQVADVSVLKLHTTWEVHLQPYFEAYDGFLELTAGTKFSTKALIACVVHFTTSIAKHHTKDA